MSAHQFGYNSYRYFDQHAGQSDPGDAGDIVLEPDKGFAYMALETGGAETRTLKDPGTPGQRLTLFMDTDGGDCTVTADTAFNETGNNTITFANTGEVVFLEAITDGGDPVWRVKEADGASLSTV